MDLRARESVEWWYDTPLVSLTPVIVPVGLSVSGITFANVHGCLFLTYGLISSDNCKLEIRGAADPTFVTYDTLCTQDALEDVYTTPYLLGGNMGLTGHLVLTRPFLRLVLTDTATANHTYTRLYAKAWGG